MPDIRDEVDHGYNLFWLRRLGDAECPESVLAIARWRVAKGLPLPPQRDPSLPVDLSRRGPRYQEDILDPDLERMMRSLRRTWT